MNHLSTTLCVVWWLALVCSVPACLKVDEAPSQGDKAPQGVQESVRGHATGDGGDAGPSEGGRAASPSQPGLPPAAEPYPEALRAKLEAALKAKGATYKPRTEHLEVDGSPRYINRLVLENSPYLLQHAHNPVDWRPWGDEAFAAAARLGRPVLLSVGYATCHWCHVMERESFEDEEIAAFINAHFVAIKVDRERRPDVDSIYMNAVRLLSGGSGGWPMTVVMTPEREPFFAGTYFPARDGDRGSRKGFLTILQELHQDYDQRPDEVVAKARGTSARVRRMAAPLRPAAIPGGDALHAGAVAAASRFDPVYKGFGRGRKFPRPVTMTMLLRHHRRTGDAEALRMVVETLDAMAQGGIHDQVGGGFHRYTVDARWMVPHFEKMLYDNAQLAQLYLEAWQVTGDARHAQIVRKTLAYVAREMTSAEGLFYSATDADSPGPDGHPEEGLFFTWTPQELAAALDESQLRAVKAYYNVSARGNFEGRNIFHVPRPLGEVAQTLKVEPAELERTLTAARARLYHIRALRAPPLTDDKVLVGWNALMISAFSRAGLALSEPSYTARAVRAAEAILEKMLTPERLQRVYKDGQVSHAGVLNDHAFLIAALLDLHEATGQTKWVEAALKVQALLDEHFWDKRAGGYFMARADAGDLMVREKPDYDGAVPAGNSVAALNLLRFHELTSEDRWRVRVEALLSAFGRVLGERMLSAPLMGAALDFHLDKARQIVLVGPADGSSEAYEPFLKALGARFVPNRVVILSVEGDAQSAQAELIPLVKGKVMRRGAPTAYVCEAQVCKRPTTDPKAFARQIAEVSPYASGPFEPLKLRPAP